jgi:type III pantothenate kinase
MNMNLAIDIGNTFTHFGLYKGGKSILTFKIPTHTKLYFSSFHKKYLVKYSGKISSIAISSVVPKLNNVWCKYALNQFGIKPLIINIKCKLPIRIKINNSSSLGSDRICLAVYGFQKMKTNVIVCGLGTANTYNVILKNGDFIGGIIAPGINTSAKALNINTGKLPELTFNKLKFDRSVIGKDTKAAIQSGLLNYPLFATEGIINAIQKEYKQKFKVIITGGSAKLLRKRLNIKAIYAENAVLDGINMILNYQNTTN